MQNDAMPSFQLPKQRHSFVLPLILGVLLLVTLVFAVWAFVGMTDYKNNSDKKSESAVASALAEQKTKLDAEYAEKEKSPYETYQASSEFGSLKLTYPRTWGMYVDAKLSGGSSTLDGYAHPNFVPGINSGDTSYALRYQVVSQDYVSVMKTFDASIKGSKASVTAFVPEKVPTVKGSKIVGEVSSKKTGVMYVLQLRDKTIKIWTESNSYAADLDKIINTLTFTP